MLTNEQKSALQTDIQADSAFGALPHNADGAYAISDAYNLPDASTWIVWRTAVSQDEIMQNGMDWTRVDNLSVGKARIWEWMFNNQERVFKPAKANVRAGIDAVWVGTSADLAVRAAVYGHCKRQATRAEKLFSTGTGSDATPATMDFEGFLTYQDVMSAMGW